MALVPRWEVSPRARTAWNVGVAVYTAIVGLLIVLDRELKPETMKWIHNQTLQIWVVGALLVLTAGDAIRRALVRSQVVAEERKRVEVRNILASAIVAIADSLKISVSQLGAGVFLVKPRGVRRTESLIRTERVRIPDDLYETKVHFTRGKGAVGSCWEHRRVIHQNLHQINDKYYDEPELIDHRWDSLSENTTKGFTKEEFTAIVGKYAEVLAVPIMDNGTLVGCIALDRRWEQTPDAGRSLLNSDATKKVLGTAARAFLATMKK